MVQVIENGKWYNVSMLQNGDKFYYHNNKLHREMGPAIELANGTGVWYWEGEKLTCKSQKEFETKFVKTAAANQYDVKIEVMLPATLTYRIAAKSPEEALEKARKTPPQNVKYRLQGKRDLKASIYDAGTLMVRLVKNLMGI